MHLTQSPIVGKKISEWKDKIENQEMLVRDIIDIDSTYEDFEASDDEEIKTKKESEKKIKVKDDKNDTEKNPDEKGEVTEEDEFNLSLAKMEEEIKPKILKLLESLNKNYLKITKISKRKSRMYFVWKRTISFKK